MVACAWTEQSLYKAIRRQAVTEEIRPADAIVVFGAAEYNGAPSPVLKARLDHVLELEDRGLAPVIITTGGSGGDPRFTEGGVARDYLIQQGVAEDKILSETHGDTTYESVKSVAQIIKQRNGRTCIAVSDGFHLYRIKLMFRSLGIAAYGSPAPASPIENDPSSRLLYSLREMVVTTLWRLGFKL
ncbi:MAG TPA: YdcF family protein [Terriglobia bacterium]|nr:YdcF family protein [Terriglobia bacterium]